MLINPGYEQARELLLSVTKAVGTENIPLSVSSGRILAEDINAGENVPPFDRSPYDGYALRALDTSFASKDAPVTLRILEEVPAGAVPTKALTGGTATKILTGAPIPEGADAVIMYEKTEFDAETVKIFSPVKKGSNIVYAGEDVKKGARLVGTGTVIDPGAAGTLAAQGIFTPLVYKKPRVAILSTGSELVDADEAAGKGKIRNSNRYVLEAALSRLGCETVYLGIAGDSVDGILALIEKGLEDCDALISTGGVSAGDYDLTPAAMEAAGAEMLIRGTAMKPGMACAYAICRGKMIFGLSGNPASALTSFYAVAMPALKKLCSRSDFLPEEISTVLASGFDKKSPTTRFLRGHLELKNGIAGLNLPKDQGNVVLSSTIGCNAMAIIPAGSGPVEAGEVLKGFLI